MAIENFVSVLATDGPTIGAALEQLVNEYDVDTMSLQRAEKLLSATAASGLIEVQLANGVTLKSKTVILSSGARCGRWMCPVRVNTATWGVACCPHCEGLLFKGKRVTVIGGGNSGVEATIDLAGITSHVILVEFDNKLRADEVLQRKLRSLSSIDIIVSAQSAELLGDGQKVSDLVYKDRVNGNVRTVELESIFVQIVLLPNTEWLKGALELSPRGEIVIDERGQTSLPGVFSAGDATTVPHKQIVIAKGASTTAALSAFDHLIRSSVAVAETRKEAVAA